MKRKYLEPKKLFGNLTFKVECPKCKRMIEMGLWDCDLGVSTCECGTRIVADMRVYLSPDNN